VGLGVGVQNALTLLKLAVIVLLAGAAFASGRAEPSLLSSGDPVPAGEAIPLAGRALLFVMMAYSGWNATSYMAGEVKDPRRVLPRAAIIGTLSVAVLYLVLNVAYFVAIPAMEMEPSPDVAVRAANHYFGSEGSLLISFVILVTQLGTISALILSGSRVYYAMAQDGLAWRGLARLSRRGAPGRAVALQGATAALLVLWIGDFERLVLYASMVLVLFSALSVAALPVLRRRLAVPGESYRAPPGAPFVYVLGAAVMLVSGGLFIAEQGAEEHVKALVAAGCIIAGIPLYFVVRFANR
jgi:APA family basic amino acid/polyamine antiporter